MSDQLILPFGISLNIDSKGAEDDTEKVKKAVYALVKYVKNESTKLEKVDLNPISQPKEYLPAVREMLPALREPEREYPLIHMPEIELVEPNSDDFILQGIELGRPQRDVQRGRLPSPPDNLLDHYKKKIDFNKIMQDAGSAIMGISSAFTGIAGITYSLGKSVLKFGKKFVKMLVALFPRASKLEQVAADIGSQFGFARGEINSTALSLGQLTNNTGASIETISALAKESARFGDVLSNTTDAIDDKSMVRLVDTLKLSAEEAVRLSKRSEALNYNLSDLLEIGAESSKKFGFTGLFKELPKLVDGAIDIFTEFGATVVGSTEDIIKGSIEAGAAISKGLGISVKDGISKSMSAIKGFQSSIRHTRDLMLGLEDGFDARTEALFSGGLSYERVMGLIEQGAKDPLAFANSIMEVADQMERAGHNSLMIERFVRNVAKNSDDYTRSLLQVPDALEKANQAAKEADMKAKEREERYGAGISFFNDMVKNMRTTGMVAYDVLKNMGDLTKELFRLTFADEVRSLFEFFIGVENKEGERIGGIFKAVNDQIIKFNKDPNGLQAVKSTLGPVITYIKSLGESLASIINDDGLSFSDKIKTIVSEVWSSIKTGSSTLVDEIFTIIEPGLDRLSVSMEDKIATIIERSFTKTIYATKIGIKTIVDSSFESLGKEGGSSSVIEGFALGIGKSFGILIRTGLLDATLSIFSSSGDGSMMDTLSKGLQVGLDRTLLFSGGLIIGTINGLLDTTVETLEAKLLIAFYKVQLAASGIMEAIIAPLKDILRGFDSIISHLFGKDAVTTEKAKSFVDATKDDAEDKIDKLERYLGLKTDKDNSGTQESKEPAVTAEIDNVYNKQMLELMKALLDANVYASSNSTKQFAEMIEKSAESNRIGRDALREAKKRSPRGINK